MSSSGGAYLGVHVFQLHPFHKHVVVEFGIPSVALSHLLLQSLVYKLDIPDEHKKWTRVTFTMFLSAMSLPHRIWQKFSSHGINPCTLSITGINFEGFLDIQLCQIQVDKFNVGLRPSVQGFNIRALKFQNLNGRAHCQFQCFQPNITLQSSSHEFVYDTFVQSFSASLYSFSFSLHAALLSLQLIFRALDCFFSSSLKELSYSMYFAACLIGKFSTDRSHAIATSNRDIV